MGRGLLRTLVGSILFVSCLAGRLEAASGTLKGWGFNRHGQLGTGVADQPSVPTPANATALSDVVAIAAAWEYTLALRADGTVWAWGLNDAGQLGSATPECNVEVNPAPCSPDPVAVPGLSGVIAIAAGTLHVLALKSDGTVWAWGDNRFGQLGDGTTTDRLSPVRVGGGTPLRGVVAVSAGVLHSVALKADGTVWAWGDSSYQQVGGGATTTCAPGGGSSVPCATTPVLVQTRTISVSTGLDGWPDVDVHYAPLAGVRALSAGYTHTLALRSDGTVWAWGSNAFGELGKGESGDAVAYPEKARDLANVEAVSAGTEFSLALLSNGTVRAWGSNWWGKLGVGSDAGPEECTKDLGGATNTQACSATPLPVPGLTSVVGVDAGGHHALAVRADGTVWAWGNNWFGQVGNGSTSAFLPQPVRATELLHAVAIAAGDYHSFALTVVNRRAAWGYDGQGQLGQDGSLAMTAMAAGDTHTLALLSAGTVIAWGSDTYGQLGDGSAGGSRSTPQAVVSLFPVDEVTAVAGGMRHSVALRANGRLFAWGGNSSGQLGDATGTYDDRPLAISVQSLGTVVAVSAGGWHNLALKADGTVWAWGDNSYGQLGVTTSSARSDEPLKVGGLSGVIAVAAGRWHSLALKDDGTVWAWGYNAQGQLGDTGGSRYSPRQVASLAEVKAIAAGGYHSLALTASGSVHAWGDNGYGQLGDGTTSDSASPRRVVLITGTSTFPPLRTLFLTGANAIAAGLRHSLALKADGAVAGWGQNTYGQATGAASTPVLVATSVGGVSGATAIAAGAYHSLGLRRW